ncbi:Rne/Rng family ribonuclease, partial [Brachybacterium hainanense]
AGAPAGAPAPAAEPAVSEEPEQSRTAEQSAEASEQDREAEPSPAAPETDAQTPSPAADVEEDEEEAPEQDAAPTEDAAAPRSGGGIAADLEALATARGAAGGTRPRAEEDRRAQAQIDFASLLFQAPAPAAPRTTVGPDQGARTSVEDEAQDGDAPASAGTSEDSRDASEDDDDSSASRRRRRRGGRGRRGRGRQDEDGAESAGEDGDESEEQPAPSSRRSRRRGERAAERSEDDSAQDAGEQDSSDAESSAQDGSSDAEDGGEEQGGASSSRRRRRRRRSGGSSGNDSSSPDDPPNTVVKVREARDEVKAVRGSTRLEAKKQRRREGRDQGRRRNVISEAEFLARRESVKRSMVVRERPGRTQIAVLEDDVLVEHYVAQKSQTSMVGNVYLGKVQNVLPSMEAAFVDIGKGRNAVLYAGEVNWDAAGLEGQPRRIELALKSGDPVLVQVTKDPIGHKGARLTSQISLPGRYVVFVPGGSMTGISRKLPDTERSRLKKIMRQVIPEDAGVIVRTAAEGASEEELTRDVERLRAQWAKIQKAQKSKNAPSALSTEPDLAIKVVRDVFNEDFTSLIVQGESAYAEVHDYVSSVAPDLLERLTRHVGDKDVFAKHRIDEQLLKAMDRKVYLPSGGSLVIDRTEAMTVVDVNTGKFTGSGGSLEETVTRNNLEAAEEIVRQLRLRDIGGIIVIDFIDMVLEANRDLVLRRLVECLGRDRTKHQVAEVTSLGLVQMTRKRVSQGLVETFSTTCEACNGRGAIIDIDGGDGHGHATPARSAQGEDEQPSRSSRRRGRSRGGNGGESGGTSGSSAKDAVAELVEERGADVHRLAVNEKARASIASIAAASNGHGAAEHGDEAAPAPQDGPAADEPAEAPVAEEPATARIAPVAAAGPEASGSEPDTGDIPAPSGPIIVKGRDRSLAGSSEPTQVRPVGEHSSLLRDVVGVAMDREETVSYAQTAIPKEQRSRTAQWVLVLAVLGVIVALVFAVTSITSTLRGGTASPAPAETTSASAEPSPSAEPTTPEETTPEAKPVVAISGAQLFARGTDREPDHLDRESRLTDGDPSSVWSTQRYNSAQYGNLKEGLGIRVSFAEPGTLNKLVVTTAENSGGLIELRADAGDGELGEVLASAPFAGDGNVTLAPEKPLTEVSSVIVWIPELPADPEGFRARIAEVRVQ